MVQITVMTHIAGSKCVVLLGSSEHYIDARQDVRYPNLSFIEVVRSGFVRHYETCHDDVGRRASSNSSRSGSNDQ